MKFCPKCGGIMLPREEGEKKYLVCMKCGHKIELEVEDKEKYKLSYKVGSEKKVVTAKASQAARGGITPEEREMLQEYYEILLEELAEEESESSVD